MAGRVLTRETLLDMVVNAVPIGILLFFVALFLAVNPWGWALLPVAISHGLLAIPIVTLAVVTYLAGRAISRDERAEGGTGPRAGNSGGGGDGPTGVSGGESGSGGSGGDGGAGDGDDGTGGVGGEGAGGDGDDAAGTDGGSTT